jgi:hypothetical protein
MTIVIAIALMALAGAYWPVLRVAGRQRSMWVALALWMLLCVGAVALHIGARAVSGSTNLGLFLLEIGLVATLTRRRPMPDLASRAPERDVALRETAAMWIYGIGVLVAGRLIGLHCFGEGIALHLNGSLVGATRVQSPREVYTWAAYNGVLLALVPYLVFRLRGYSREALNLTSADWRNDLLVIAVVMGIGIAFDLTGPAFLQLTPHQQLAGGTLSFLLHLCGTDLPIMIFIYSILVPRYCRLVPPLPAFLLGAASYPAMHIFESWATYDTLAHGATSLILVFLTFFPPGVVKSFLTMRTGNAWVHMWGFHAVSPHVTIDTRLIVHDFDIAP